jgi:hypothetical protein
MKLRTESLIKNISKMLRRHHMSTHDDYNLTMPTEPANTDLYLVAFPKSGITWLSYMMANINLLMSGKIGQRASLFNLNDLIPDIHVSRNLVPPTMSFPGFRIIKSHSNYNPKYTKVILLVRNPIDVMASYFVFLTALNQFSGSISEMITHPSFGVGAWTSHTTGWLDNARPEMSFCLVKYEDLRNDPQDSLRELYRLMGIDLSDETLTVAAERSNLFSMRSDEDHFNTRHPALAGFEFVRRGADRGPRTVMDERSLQIIREAAGSTFSRLGYLS